MSLLFDAPVIPRLELRESFITSAEHDELVEHLDAADLERFRFHGWLGNRKTRTFGWRYDFDDASFAPTDALSRSSRRSLARRGWPPWAAATWCA